MSQCAAIKSRGFVMVISMLLLLAVTALVMSNMLNVLLQQKMSRYYAAHWKSLHVADQVVRAVQQNRNYTVPMGAKVTQSSEVIGRSTAGAIITEISVSCLYQKAKVLLQAAVSDGHILWWQQLNG